jgi:enediyne polyketide synthase
VRPPLRSSSTQFKLDHFTHLRRAARGLASTSDRNVELEPTRDLYGPLLFHTGRFQRIRRYRLLTATHCVAELTPSSEAPFHRYQSQDLLLGDLTIRDAAIHALQASVPQGTVPRRPRAIGFFAPVDGDDRRARE